jgi:hypothetical protein
MSQLIKDAPTITELELKNVEPYPEQKFEDLFKLDHLPAHHKKLAERIFKKHKKTFSKHDQDIGRVNCIKMDIQIDETKPQIQNIFQSLMQLDLNFDKFWTKWKNTTSFENATNHRCFAVIY